MDKTFDEATREALRRFTQEREKNDAEVYEAVAKMGGRIGAYYRGMTLAGCPEDLAAKLAESYAAWLIEQVQLAAEGIRAVKDRG